MMKSTTTTNHRHDSKQLLLELERRSITATTEHLDERIRAVMDELDLRPRTVVPAANLFDDNDDKLLQEQFLEAARNGDLGRLRRIVWGARGVPIIPSCALQAAAAASATTQQQQQLRTLHWLVTEAGCEIPVDCDGRITVTTTSLAARELLQRLHDTDPRRTTRI